MGWNDYQKTYENSQFQAIVRSDEEIKRDFSTIKYKIGEEFLNFVHEFEHLWKDTKYLMNYLITPQKNDSLHYNYYNRPSSEHEALFVNNSQTHIIDLCWRMCNNHNVIYSLMGDTGSGKSMFSIDDCYIINEFVNKVLGLDRKFTVDNICFSRSELVEVVPSLKTCESAIMDEDNESVLGIGSFTQWDKVNRQEKTLRSLSKNFYNNSPDLRKHNEHYVLKCMGINDVLKTNKVIFRERDKTWEGFYLTSMFKGNKYNKLIKAYERKKKKFQKELENSSGDDKRLVRILDMCVFLINKWSLTYDLKDVFDTLISSEFKLSVGEVREVKKNMLVLLDDRIGLFKEWKDKVKGFVGVKSRGGRK